MYRGVSLDISHYDKPIRSFKTHRPMNWTIVFAQGCQLNDTQMMLIAAKNGAKKCIECGRILNHHQIKMSDITVKPLLPDMRAVDFSAW